MTLFRIERIITIDTRFRIYPRWKSDDAMLSKYTMIIYPSIYSIFTEQIIVFKISIFVFSYPTSIISPSNTVSPF